MTHSKPKLPGENEMVERVVYAMTECEASDPISLSAIKVLARAAIEAMMEPTLDMVRVGNAAIYPIGHEGACIGDSKHCWQDMIDAALK